MAEQLICNQQVVGSTPITSSKKKASFVFRTKALFSVILACGELYCVAVLFGLRRVILRFAQFKGEYNITATNGSNITMPIGIPMRHNITAAKGGNLT